MASSNVLLCTAKTVNARSVMEQAVTEIEGHFWRVLDKNGKLLEDKLVESNPEFNYR